LSVTAERIDIERDARGTLVAFPASGPMFFVPEVTLSAPFVTATLRVPSLRASMPPRFTVAPLLI
jgi:hypothetical protein